MRQSSPFCTNSAIPPSLPKPLPRLKPLPVLEGFVPEGWKDAIYEFD